jgi:hypothetical protein
MTQKGQQSEGKLVQSALGSALGQSGEEIDRLVTQLEQLHALQSALGSALGQSGGSGGETDRLVAQLEQLQAL